MEQSWTRARAPQTLGELLAAPGVLVARCGCGAVTPINVALAGDLRRASLSRLEKALRCTCGARSGSIEVWPSGLATPRGPDRLFLFASG